MLFILCGGATYPWDEIRLQKAHLEQQADSYLSGTSATLRNQAGEETCPVGDHFALPCRPVYTGPQMDAVRSHLIKFPYAYQEAVSKSPQHTAIWMMTLWEGTMDGGRKKEVFSLAGTNIILDVCGAFLVMSALQSLSRARSLFRMLLTAAISTVIGSVLSSMSIAIYNIVSAGNLDGAFFIWCIPCGLLILIFGTRGVAGIVKSSTTKPIMKVLGVASCSVLVLALSLGLLVLGTVPLILAPLTLPKFSWSHRLDDFFYLVALVSLTPTLLGLASVFVLVGLGTFARALLGPTILWLRTALRMPTPVLITLTAAPVLIAQGTVSSWVELHRMLGLCNAGGSIPSFFAMNVW